MTATEFIKNLEGSDKFSKINAMRKVLDVFLEEYGQLVLKERISDDDFKFVVQSEIIEICEGLISMIKKFD